MQASFFLDYITELRGYSSEYKKSILLYKEYLDNQKNYHLEKEDFDIVIKLGHVLTAQQKYDEANKFYDSILHESGNKDHTNALLGICTTHFQTKDKNSLERSLNQCEKAIGSLKKQKYINGTDRKNEKIATAYYNQGCVQMRLGEYDKAKDSFEDGAKSYGENR